MTDTLSGPVAGFDGKIRLPEYTVPNASGGQSVVKLAGNHNIAEELFQVTPTDSTLHSMFGALKAEGWFDPQDWKSGDKLWAVEVIAPFGGPEEMIKDLKAKVFPAREVRFVAVTHDGKKEVRSV